MIKVLVADDSPTVRELLASILEGDERIQVVGRARNGLEAVELAKRLRPDVVTMDVHMPELDGFQATKEIMVEAPTRIIIVSSTVTDEAVGSSLDATRAGALMVMTTPEPASPRFAEQAGQLVAMVTAMADVKVVRRHRARVTSEEPSPRRDESRSTDIVAIAASTGGPAALHRILIDLPRDFPVPIVAVQHISVDFVEGLCRWLDSHCNLRVRLAGDGDALEARTVHLAPDGHHLGTKGRGVAALSSDPPVDGFRPSGSFLFESVARDYGASAAAVVLTGMGSDGSTGVPSIRQAGGHVIAQDEASSVVYGMPGAAVRTGAVDQILPLHEIAARLVDLTRGVHRAV